MRKTLLSTISLIACAFGSLLSQAAEPAQLPFNPQDGETVVFLGDSITHQCLYTQYLENFFITRYPNRRINFHNAGVGGDTAADALARLEHDIARFKPNYVTVHLGMNDGRYEDFNPEHFAAYEQGISELVKRIKALGAKPILLSPTMFDHNVVKRRKDDTTWRFQTKEFSQNYNALMAFYGGWGLEEAARNDAPFVNLWAPLNTHTIEQRRKNPEFTMITDAIHPQASGQMVMAFETLFQLGVERKSANSITISKRGKQWAGTKGIQNLEVNEEATEVQFSFKAKSLPWVIPVEESTQQLKWLLPSDGRVGYAITKAGHKMSAERLKIAGLAPGTYEISIDDAVIGRWNHIALGTKIELQENEKTPQYQQALKVALLNQKRNDEHVRPLRTFVAKIKGIRRAIELGGKTEEDLASAITAANEASQKALAELDGIYEAAKPVEHRWVVRKVE